MLFYDIDLGRLAILNIEHASLNSPLIKCASFIFNFQKTFRIHSLATGPIHYRINWQAKGIPQRNGFASTNIDTKEVILGKSDSGSNSGGGISFIGVSSATPTISYLLTQHGRIIALFYISAFFYSNDVCSFIIGCVKVI